MVFQLDPLMDMFSLIFTQVFEKPGEWVFSYFNIYSRPILDALHLVFNSVFNVVLVLTVVLTLVYLVLTLITRFKKPTIEQVITDDSKLPNVTIQIPTYNELAALNCAEKCLAFDYPKAKMQIIVGDDSNDPIISEKITAFATKTGITVTRRGKNIGFKPGNLNHMLKFTTGDFLVIFDSDFLPEKDFLRRIISPFVTDENIHGVQGRWKMINFSQNFSSIIGSTIPMFSHMLGLPFMQMVGSTGFIAGSAEAVRIKTLKQLGGWTSGAFTEDIEYSMRMTKAGKKVVYLENLECACESPFTVADLCKQQLRWAYGVIKSCKLHFVDIILSKKIPTMWKINPILLLAGYLVTFQFFLLFVLGILSIITHEPSPINWALLFSKTGLNIFFTSGFVISSVILLNRSSKRKDIPKMILASFSVGLLVVYKVSEGVLKALFNRPMFWFMLNKKGNN